MQINDQQFINAMYRAVEVGGCDRVAPGMYREAGVPSCIVGMALAQIHMDIVPWDNRELAYALVTRLGCSERVALAAHWAQYANDTSLAWGDVKVVFDKGLSLYDDGHRKGIFFEGVMHDLVMALRAKANEARLARRKAEALHKAQSSKVAGYATGGVIKSGNYDALVAELNNLSTALQKITFPTFVELTDKNLAVNPSLSAMGIEPPHVKIEFSLVS